MFVILICLSTIFWDITQVINKLLVSLCKDKLIILVAKFFTKFFARILIKGTPFISAKTYPIGMTIVYWLFAIKKT